MLNYHNNMKFFIKIILIIYYLMTKITKKNLKKKYNHQNLNVKAQMHKIKVKFYFLCLNFYNNFQTAYKFSLYS